MLRAGAKAEALHRKAKREMRQMKHFCVLHANGVSSTQKYEALCDTAAKHEAALARHEAKPCGFIFFAFFGKKGKKMADLFRLHPLTRITP